MTARTLRVVRTSAPAAIAAACLAAATSFAQDAPTEPPAARSARPTRDPARDQTPASYALWLQPAWMFAIGPLQGRYNLSGGINAYLGPHVQLVIEASFEWGCYSFLRPDTRCAPPRVGHYAGLVSVGVAIQTHAGRRFEGFFLQPKLVLAGFATYASDSVNPSRGLGSIMGAAVDFGFQVNRGPFYLAIVGGVGFGLGMGSDLAPPSNTCGSGGTGCVPLALNYISPSRGPQFGLNVGVVRMGVAF